MTIPESPLPGAFSATPPAPAPAAEASNRFALDLYRALLRPAGPLDGNAQAGNLVFSPLSLSTALGMTALGADGATAQEMARVLHLDAPDPGARAAVHDAIAQLATELSGRPGVSLQVANRLWGQNGFHFQPDFLAEVARAYGAGLAEVDFAQPETARATINAWVADHTAAKIPQLIPPGVLSPDTSLVLTNAIVFKGRWAAPFPPSATTPAPFHRPGANPVDVPMMRLTTRLPYAEVEGDNGGLLQIVELPYEQAAMSLVVLLPRPEQTLADVESSLDADRLSAWLQTLQPRRVQLALPRFRSSSALRLEPPLQALGMVEAFGPRADFLRISRDEPLAISAVVHQAVIDVDEQGTEAAAATAVGLARTSAAIPEPPLGVTADRPFLYLLRDRATGTLLFLGRLADPAQP